MPLPIATLFFVVSMVTSGLAVALVRVVAERRAILDRPNERSSHVKPMPHGGGIAVAVITLIALAAEARPPQPAQASLGLVTAAAAAVAVISWADDIRGVSTIIRLMVHVAAAAAAVTAFGPLRTVYLDRSIPLGALSVPFTLLWIVGFTNAYNFMDGIDGIAGSQAIVAGLAWTWAGARVQQPWISVVGITVAGAAAGFLIHNWQPARIFMGDVGSAFMGYILSTMTVAAARSDARFFLFGVLTVWPFIADTSFTLVRRSFRREDLFRAHRTHVYQRLNQIGWSHARIAFLYTTLSALGAIAGAAMIEDVPGALTGAIVVVLLSSAIVWSTLAVAERRRATLIG